VIAGLCALIGWRLQAWATADPKPPVPVVNQPPDPAPVPPSPTAGRSDLSPGTSTLARVAQPEAPPTPATEPATPTMAPDDELLIADSEGEAIDDESPGSGGADQLSAADFRKVLLRTNRSQKVRSCYERHGPGDVQLVALVGRGGKVLKLRMDDGTPLADCLRKVVLRLEFPRAARQAQHNYVFHAPTDGEG